jgi:hypothetical protein
MNMLLVNKMTELKKNQMPNQERQNTDLQPCDCKSDPFANLPPELRPKQKSWKSGLRNVTCPGWTNQESDYCSKCMGKGFGRQGGSAGAD